MITGPQIRAARALIGWTQDEIASRTGLSVQTIKRMEGLGTGRSALDTVMAVQRAFEAAGVIFIPENGEGPGVRLAKTKSNAE